MKIKRTLHGGEEGADVFAVQRALNRWSRGRFPKIPLTRRYDLATRSAVRRFQTVAAIAHPDGVFRQETLDSLWRSFDRYGRLRYRLARPPSPPPVIGPVFAGGQSVLAHDLTHETSGLPLYPAFDDAFREGTPIIAPEPLRVTNSSSSRPGLAFYATGASKIRYWFGHLDRTHSPGTRFARGDLVGHVAHNAIGGGPHVHVGVNVEGLLGAGRELIHHSDYSHGAPTIGEQLARVTNVA